MEYIRLVALGEPGWVTHSGGSGRLSLPALLLLRLRLAQTPLTKSEIIAQFWPDRTEKSGRQNLRQTLLRIRTLFPLVDLRSQSELLTLSSSVISVDVVDATHFSRQGNFARALTYHRGRFLEGLKFDSIELDHWVDRQRASQARQVRECLLQLMSQNPEAVPTIKDTFTGFQAILPSDPIVHVARALLQYYEGHLSQAKWWLNRLPSALPHEVRSLSADLRKRLNRVPRMPKPTTAPGIFVGRSDEFALLQAEWAAVETGRVRHVHLVGAVAVGKTRLSHQISRWAAIRGGRVVRARAVNEKTIARQILDQLEANEGLPDPAATTKSRHDSEHAAAIVALERECADRAVLLVIDDLQHLNTLTIRLLRELRSVTSPSRLLVLLVARIAEEPITERSDHVIVLGKLSDEDIQQLILSIDPALRSTDYEKAIIRSSNGNPLLAKRYARLASSATDADAILTAIAHRDRTVLHNALLRGHCVARRRLLEIVALARTPLGIACLRDVTGMRGSALRGHVSALYAEGVLMREGSYFQISPDYEPSELLSLVPDQRRRRYHRALARSFIGRGVKYLQAIAYHLEAAGELRSAFRYYLKSARVHLRATNRETTEALLASAMRLADADMLQSPELETLRADFHYEWEEYGLAAPIYRALIRKSGGLSSRSQLRCRIRYLRSAASIGVQRSGYNTQKAVLAAAQRLGDPELELEAAYAAFARLSDTAERAEYRQLAGEFWRLSQRWPDEAVAVRALCQAALLYLGGGKPDLALRTARFAIDHSTAMPGHVAFESHVVHTTVDICRGDLLSAGHHARTAEKIMATLNKVPRRKLWGINLGVYYLECGDWTRAEMLFHDLYHENQRKAAGAGNVVVATNLSILYYEQRNFTEAMRFAVAAQQLDGQLTADSTPAHAVEGLIHWMQCNRRDAIKKSEMIARGGTYFGDHSYAALLNARVHAESSQSLAATTLKQESARWRRIYYPGSARMDLEALAISENRTPEQLTAFALDAQRRGLMPIYESAQGLLNSSPREGL